MPFANTKSLTIPEGSVKKITRKSDGVVLWEKVTSRIPSAYQEVEWIQAGANVGAYINLGFSYNTGAIIKLGQWVMNDNTAYPFGTSESGTYYRCALSIPYYGATAYFSPKIYSNKSVAVQYIKNALNEFEATYKVGDFQFENLTTGEKATSSDIGSYAMSDNLYLFAQNYNGSPRFGDIRRIAYFQYYDKNNTLICDLVPCYRKSDGVIGMYDIVRNIFLANVGSGTFTKGANV